MVEQNVAIRIGKKTSVGLPEILFSAIAEALKAIILVGISVSPDVLRTRNKIWALEASFLFGFSFCSSSIALSPSGVAALSSPRILAEIFMIIAPWALEFLGISGNNFWNNGANNFESKLTAPPFSPIFIIPSHKAIIPVNPNDSLKPSSARSKIELTITVKISGSP